MTGKDAIRVVNRLQRETGVSFNPRFNHACRILMEETNRMITYKEMANEIAVFLEGKRVGTIQHIFGEGWKYFPKGSRTGGDFYQTLRECKNSLEGM